LFSLGVAAIDSDQRAIGHRMSQHATPRHPRLDALRGLAVLWMVVFHFSYDLSHFRFTHQNFYTDPVWTLQRTVIVSLFLFCAGLGQAVAQAQQQRWPRFWRRWAQVAACAVLVSAGSWFIFGHRFISFGVLHAVALMLLILRAAFPMRLPMSALLVLGALAILLPTLLQLPAFDSRWLNWLGWVTRKPATEDYVPLFPWLGVVLWGFATGVWLLRRRAAWLQGALPSGLEPLATLGRYSLSIYMLHQPLLFGLLMAIVWLKR
jgi:uncharacterized membrane protein